jgi:fructosamine-3-kinase
MRRRDGELPDPDVTPRLERVVGAAVLDCRGIDGQHGVRHCRVTLADGRTAFAKLAGEAADSEAAGFAAEARGLRWLGEAGAVPVPEVLGWDEAALVISWVPEEAPVGQAAERFGRDLARLHAAGAAAFGAPWPGSIAGLPLPNDAGTSWPEWYATQRLLPYSRRARTALARLG